MYINTAMQTFCISVVYLISECELAQFCWQQQHVDDYIL